VYVELVLSSNARLYLYLGPQVSGFVRICKEKPQHLGLSEAQALCYVQEVLSRAQYGNLSGIYQAIRLLNGWRAHCTPTIVPAP
jgi:hypothetical protein